MDNSKISLMSLISEMINEIGDLKNISTFDIKIEDDGTYTFQVPLPNGKVEEAFVGIGEILPEMRDELNLPPVFEYNDETEIYGIDFALGNSFSQYIKSDLKLYSKILATVVKVVKDIIKKTENPTNRPIYTLGSTSKEGVVGSKDIKLRYYKAILNQNLPSGYRMGEGNWEGIEILAFQKIKN